MNINSQETLSLINLNLDSAPSAPKTRGKKTQPKNFRKRHQPKKPVAKTSAPPVEDDAIYDWTQLTNPEKFAYSLMNVAGKDNVLILQEINNFLKERGSKMSNVAQLFNIFSKIEIKQEHLDTALRYKGISQNVINSAKSKIFELAITSMNIFQVLETISRCLVEAQIDGENLSVKFDGQQTRSLLTLNDILNTGFFSSATGRLDNFLTEQMKFVGTIVVAKKRTLYSAFFHECVGIYPFTYPKEDAPLLAPEYGFSQNDLQSLNSATVFGALPHVILNSVMRKTLGIMQEDYTTSHFHNLFIHDPTSLGTQGHFFIFKALIDYAASSQQSFELASFFCDTFHQTTVGFLKSFSPREMTPAIRTLLDAKVLTGAWEKALMFEAIELVQMFLPSEDYLNKQPYANIVNLLLLSAYKAQAFWRSKTPVSRENDLSKALPSFLKKGYPNKDHSKAAQECAAQRNALTSCLSKLDILTPLGSHLGVKDQGYLQSLQYQFLSSFFISPSSPKIRIIFVSNLLATIISNDEKYAANFIPFSAFVRSTDPKDLEKSIYIVVAKGIRFAAINEDVVHLNDKNTAKMFLTEKITTIIHKHIKGFDKERTSRTQFEVVICQPKISQTDHTFIMNTVRNLNLSRLKAFHVLMRPQNVGHGRTSLFFDNEITGQFPNPSNSSVKIAPFPCYFYMYFEADEVKDAEQAILRRGESQQAFDLAHIVSWHEALKRVPLLFDGDITKIDECVTRDTVKRCITVFQRRQVSKNSINETPADYFGEQQRASLEQRLNHAREGLTILKMDDEDKALPVFEDHDDPDLIGRQFRPVPAETSTKVPPKSKKVRSFNELSEDESRVPPSKRPTREASDQLSYDSNIDDVASSMEEETDDPLEEEDEQEEDNAPPAQE